MYYNIIVILILVFYNNKLIVLDTTLKGIQVVYDSITERFFLAPGPGTKYFERFFSINKQFIYVYNVCTCTICSICQCHVPRTSSTRILDRNLWLFKNKKINKKQIQMFKVRLNENKKKTVNLSLKIEFLIFLLFLFC